MTEESRANLEMAITLPLGVVANQLMKIEANLRLLESQTGDFAKERDNGRLAGLIEGKLDDINESLDSIRCIVSNIEAGIRTGAAAVAARRKPSPDLDD